MIKHYKIEIEGDICYKKCKDDFPNWDEYANGETCDKCK